MLRAPPKLSRTSKRSRSTSSARPLRKGSIRTVQRWTGIPKTVAIGRQSFPPKLRNTLVYADTLNSLYGTGSAVYVFAANGVYDPNITSVTNHQPLYLDQMFQIYNHCIVLRSRIKVTFTPVMSATNTGGYLQQSTVYIEDNANGATTAIEAAERPGATTKMWNVAGGCPTLYMNWDAVAAFGPNPTANDLLRNSIASNPTELMYYHCSSYDSQGQSGNGVISAIIEYDVEWSELSTIAQS